MYIAIAATNLFHGQEFLEPQMRVMLVRKSGNYADSEAIKVEKSIRGES